MRAPWTLGRVIAVAFSLLLVGFGVECLFEAHQLDQDFERWQTAKPLDAPIDFSMPGRFVLAFDQTCSSSHGETVVLKISSRELRENTNVTQLLAGLDAKLEVIEKSGSNTVTSSNFQIAWAENAAGGPIPIFRISPFTKGIYEAIVTVNEGAPALKGIAQRLEGRYELCGLERLPATIGNVLGVVCITLGIIIGIIVSLVLDAHRRKPHLSKNAAPNGG